LVAQVISQQQAYPKPLCEVVLDMDESVIPPHKSYLAFSITKCPTDRCEDCVGFYTNQITGITVSCNCPCKHNDRKEETRAN